MSLLKYLHAAHLKDYLDGHLRFQPLAYFRREHEGAGVGDLAEGSREHLPDEGLTLNTANGPLRTDFTFVSKVSDCDFFVHCLSRPPIDWAGLNYEACVEICEAKVFTQRVTDAIKVQFPGTRVVQRRVVYYQTQNAPGTLWADPTAIVFSKPATSYAQQREFRCAFGQTEHFEIGRTAQQLVRGGPTPATEIPSLRMVEIGDIRDISREHHRAA